MAIETIDVTEARKWLKRVRSECSRELAHRPRMGLERRMLTVAAAVDRWDSRTHGSLSLSLLVIAWTDDLGIIPESTTKRHLLLRLIYVDQRDGRPLLDRRRIAELAVVLERVEGQSKNAIKKSAPRKSPKLVGGTKSASRKK